MTDATATQLKIQLFGGQYRGKKLRAVVHMCNFLNDELDGQIVQAANFLNLFVGSGRLNPEYSIAIKEASAQQICKIILNLKGVTGDYAIANVIQKSIKPVTDI